MSVHFTGTGGVLATLAVAAAALGLAAWLYRRVLAVRGGRALLALRLASVAALVLLLARPVVSWERARFDDGRIVVLADSSRSMSIHDAMGGAERVEAARKILGNLVPRLERLAPVEITSFDVGFRSVATPDIGAIRAVGEGSDLAKAFRAALEGSTRVVGVVLVSDGQETGAESVSERAATAGVPVHVVAIGSSDASAGFRDGAVTRVEVDREAFVHSTVAVRVDLRTIGYETTPGAVELRRGEEVVARKELALAPGRTEALLAFTPKEPGLFEFEVRLAALPGEKILENNSRWFVLAVTAEKMRVLYYEGTPRWEYRYVKKALSKDPNVAFSGLVRTNVDRVYQQGSAELKTFPASREALDRYQVVILGDVGREDLTAGQAALLRQYVEDGGGLLVAGGRKLFGADGLRGSALENVLPLALAGASSEVAGTLVVEVAREGASHPVLVGLPRLLPLGNVFTAGGAKPGAQVLLAAGGHPLVTAQRYGQGRVMLLASDTDWTWCTSGRERGGEDLFGRFWGQSVRWLANRDTARSAGESGARLSTDRDIYAPGEPVRITLKGAEAPAVTVEEPGGRTEVTLEKGEGTFEPRAGGVHVAACGELRRTFFVERSAREMEKVTVNEELLRRIAATTNGSYFTQVTAKDLPEALVRSSRREVSRGEWSAENSPWFFLFFVLVIGADWAVRKWLQLA